VKTLLSIVLVAMGVLIGLGGLAHSFMGRLAVDAELSKFPIAFDVDSMLYVVWYFVGGCMVLFGVIILWAWFRWRKGDPTLLQVTVLIGVLYFATGLGGFFYRHSDPFMLVFLIQGLLLVTCSVVLSASPPRMRA
jgi:hypothetical protein